MNDEVENTFLVIVKTKPFAILCKDEEEAIKVSLQHKKKIVGVIENYTGITIKYPKTALTFEEKTQEEIDSENTPKKAAKKLLASKVSSAKESITKAPTKKSSKKDDLSAEID